MPRLTLGKTGLICVLAVASLPVLSQQTLPDGPKPKEQQSVPRMSRTHLSPSPSNRASSLIMLLRRRSIRTLTSQKPRQPQRPSRNGNVVQLRATL